MTAGCNESAIYPAHHHCAVFSDSFPDNLVENVSVIVDILYDGNVRKLLYKPGLQQAVHSNPCSRSIHQFSHRGLLYTLYPVGNSPEFWEQNQQFIRLLLVVYQLVNLILLPLCIVVYKYYGWEKAYKKHLASIEDELNAIARKIIDRHK